MSAREPLANAAGPQRSLAGEAWALMKLAAPTFVGQVSFTVMKATDSSLVGHVGTEYLEAVALSDLWTSATGVFIQTRAAAPLCSQAFGAGNKPLVGVYIQVAYVVVFSVCVLVALTWSLTGVVLRALGRQEDLCADAQYFALVLMLCLPVRVAFSQLSTFFAAQRILWPGAGCAAVAMLSNLVFGLLFVLGKPIPGWDGFRFWACPWVTTVVEYGQFALFWLVFCKCKQLHKDCWPGWSRDHITKELVGEFLKQYVPQSLGLASDFWRVSAIGAIASNLGDVEVAVWNTSYRICWIVLIFIGSLGMAMSIKLGNAMGAGDTASAKRQALAGVIICVGMLSMLCTLVVCIPRQCGMLFSDDPVVLDAFERSRWALAAWVGSMNMANMLDRIPVTVGRPKTSLWLGVVASWLGQVPGAYLCTKYWRQDLVAVYVGSAMGYALMILMLIVTCLSFDWQTLTAEAQRRSQVAVASRPPPREERLHGASLQPIPKDATSR